MTDDAKSDRQYRERLAALIAAYGADRTRWPEADALAYAQNVHDDELASRAADAADLDRLLDAATAPVTPPGTSARIMQQVEAQHLGGQANAGSFQRSSSRAAFIDVLVGSWRPSAVLLTACLLLGVYLGQADYMDVFVGDAFTSADAGTDVVGEALAWLSFDPDAIVEETL